LLEARRGLTGVRFIRGLEPSQADALLVIGDTAMRMRNQRPEGFTLALDLGTDWHEWTGLPFVYAVWTVRSALEGAVKADLRAFLDASLAAGLSDLAAVARQWTGPGWRPDEMEAYLRRFHYRLGPEDLAGLERFRALLVEHGLMQEG
jgi:chorismate dehydratase